ncbi:MAG: DUF3592 domain-containing protein [Usitatibacteraceae bacterium]
MTFINRNLDDSGQTRSIQRGLLVLVGLLMLAAAVLGYVALQNELSYRTIMRDPVRVEADMIDGRPSGRFGYAVRFRFTVDGLRNADTIHVGESDWQWISTSNKVPVIYARENPRLFYTNPEVYRHNANREGKVAGFLLLMSIAVVVAGLWQRRRTANAPSRRPFELREGPRVYVFVGILISVVAVIFLNMAAHNFLRHREVLGDWQQVEGEIVRNWHERRGMKGIRYRFGEYTGASIVHAGSWRQAKIGDRVPVYVPEGHPELSMLNPGVFLYDSVIALFGGITLLGFLIFGLIPQWRQSRADAERLKQRHSQYQAGTL